MSTLDVTVLERAKQALTTNGWTKNDMLDCTNGKLCALGALQVGLGKEVVRHSDGDYIMFSPYDHLRPDVTTPEYQAVQAELYLPASLDAWARHDALWDAFYKAEGEWEDNFAEYSDRLDGTVQSATESFSCVADWNDARLTTVEDVIALFDDTIAEIKRETK